MVIRAIALSMALLIGVGVLLPLATETTEAGPRQTHKYRKHRKHRRAKWHSKRWWRQYHARMRKRRALARRRRALRLRQLRLARARRMQRANGVKAVKKDIVKTSAPQEPAGPALLPSGEIAPASWRRGSSTPGELRFGVVDSSGQQVGSASISVVGPAMGETIGVGRNRTLAGVPTTSLRREVINRMISENGWVINDYQKDIAGQKVYVVVAQSQNGGRLSSRMFYFTEVDGRIYNVATTSNPDSAERLAEESEKVINSLQSRRRPAQRAALQE